MAITVNLKTKNGINTNRKFELSQGISVYGKLTGVTGMFEPFTFFRIEVFETNGLPIYYKEGTTDLFGGFDGYFLTPEYPAKMKIIVNATYTISGSDKTEIRIASGGLNPDENPNPETEKTILEYLPLILIIFLIGFLYLTFFKNKI